MANNRNSDEFAVDYDLIIGPVANDRTMPVIKMFLSGIYDEEETIKRLLLQRLTDQYAFKSDKALRALRFNGVIYQ